MATLPADRTKLALAQANQVPSAVASAQRNIDTLTEAYDTIDLLNQKVDTHANAATLPHADGSVTTAKLANGAATTPKIADLAVTAAKVANQSLTADKFVPGALTNDTENALRITALEADSTQRGINVKSSPYNAKGDGVTDDRAAIQAAIDACELTGGQVYFPPGNYINSSSRITINSPNVTVKGYGATITIKDGANARPFVIQETADIEVNGITFRNETTTGSINGLDIQNSSRVTVRDCKFYDYTFYGIVICENTDKPTSDPTYKAPCDDIIIERNYFNNCQTFGLEHFPKVLSKNASIIDNTFINCGLANSSGSAMKPGQATINTIIRGNKIYGGQIGISLGNWESNLVEGNEIYNTERYGIAITTSIHSLYTAGFQSLEVKNNTFHHASSFTPSAATQCMTINGGNDGVGIILLERNVVDNWSSAGFLIRGSVSIPNIKFKKNIFRNCKGTSTADNASGAYPVGIVFEGNEFHNDDVTKSYQVQLMGNNHVILRNNFYQYGEYNLYLNGTNVEVRENRFISPNPTAVASRAPIILGGAGTYYVYDNYVSGGTSAYIMITTLATAVIAWGNQSTGLISIASDMSKISTGNYFRSEGKGRQFYGTAAPVSGAYVVGDIVWNTAPTAGGNIGWICTTAGSPGTWKTFGSIGA